MLGEIQNITDRSIDPAVKSRYLTWKQNPAFQPADLYFTEIAVSSSTYIEYGMNNSTVGKEKQ
jgi:hypothetical protein